MKAPMYFFSRYDSMSSDSWQRLSPALAS